MNMIEKVDLTKAYYLQHLITEHYQECMDEWYKKCKFKKDKEVEMKKVEKYIREVIKANGELSTSNIQAFKRFKQLWATICLSIYTVFVL